MFQVVHQAEIVQVLGGSAGANEISVSNLTVKSAGYGGYTVKAVIVPNKDVSYLEMVAISYDKSGAVIDRSPLVWNTNDAKQGQVYKVTGSVYLQDSAGKPVKMDILIFDSAFGGGSEEGNIYKKTVKVS